MVRPLAKRRTDIVGTVGAHFNFLTHFKFQLAINVMQSNTLNHFELANNANTNKPRQLTRQTTLCASDVAQVRGAGSPYIHFFLWPERCNNNNNNNKRKNVAFRLQMAWVVQVLGCFSLNLRLVIKRYL